MSLADWALVTEVGMTLYPVTTPPTHRAWVVVILRGGTRHIARYSRVNHVWMLPGGIVVWPQAWYED